LKGETLICNLICPVCQCFVSLLNLSKRELGDTRVNQIAALLQDKHCKLNTLMWVFHML